MRLTPCPRTPPHVALPKPDPREIAAIFAGGALGTLARAALAEAFPHSATAWPWPTFAVNIVAAFLLGYFVTRLQERLPLSVLPAAAARHRAMRRALNVLPRCSSRS